MQVLEKNDLFFVPFIATIILATAVASLFVLSWTIVGPAFLAIEAIYIGSALKKPLRRFRAVKKAFPSEWREALFRHSVFYPSLNEEGQKRFERDMQIFLTDFAIEGIRGETVEPGIKILIAMGVATMLHGRPRWEPPVSSVLVYPGERFDDQYRIGRGNFVGQAPHRGPLIFTAGSMKKSFADPLDGFNVLFHEMAHGFDWEDGFADGVPAARMHTMDLVGWKETVNREWKRARDGESVLSDYAGTNEAEFLAVACEFFFESPWDLEGDMPEFYAALKKFFNLDPARMLR
jgi:Mlc titration factor MtfA (ptsG expression regulator)